MDVIKELKWFFIILVILWIVWFFTGGPARFENKPFLKPAAPLDTGQPYR